MKKIALTNSFHNTKCTVLTHRGTAEAAWLEIQAAAFGPDSTKLGKDKYRRIKKRLCGAPDCDCGTVF